MEAALERRVAVAPVSVAVFGVSTPFTYWGFRLIYRLMEALAGETLHLHLSDLAGLHEGFARREGRSVIVTADLPQSDLVDFVCATDTPVVAFADDIGDLLAWSRTSRDLGPDDAARFVSHMVSALAPAFCREGALIVRPSQAVDGAALAAALVWRLFGEAAARREDWLRLAAACVAQEALPERAVATIHGDEDGELQRAAREAVADYAVVLQGRAVEEIGWPLPLFSRGDKRPWADPVDLTGPARALLYGPYLHLPAGNWIARFEFEIAGALSGVETVTDIRIHEVVTQRTLAMPASGFFAYELGFRVADPGKAVEIRLFMKRSAIEGLFLPRSIRVRRAP